MRIATCYARYLVRTTRRFKSSTNSKEVKEVISDQPEDSPQESPWPPADPKVRTEIETMCKNQFPTVLYTGRHWPTTLLHNITLYNQQSSHSMKQYL